jgi:hypothetical protein
MLIRKNLRRLITPWVILGSFLVGFSLMGAALLLFWLAMPDPVPAGIPTAAMTVVAYPTNTPTLTLSTQTEIPTTTVTPTPCQHLYRVISHLVPTLRLREPEEMG